MKSLTFPNELKIVDVSPIHKKDRYDKSNHRPVNVLTLLSKPFEHNLFEQIDSNIKDILSWYEGELEKSLAPNIHY